MRSFRRPHLGLIWLLLALALAPGTRAQPSGQAALADQLRDLLVKAGLGDRVALSVVDLASGRPIFAERASLPLNPASNLKLLTAATAMLELGPEFRMHTTLFGRMQGNALPGGVCLKGEGDPTLTRADLAAFAQRLASEGVRTLERVSIDGSYFDGAILPPAFEQQPNESAPFRAAVAALSLNANAYSLRVRPAEHAGKPALVSVDGARYFEIEDGVETLEQGKPSVSVVERELGERVRLTLRGGLPLGAAELSLDRRVSQPLSYAGYTFIESLNAAGIKTPKRAQIEPCPPGAPVLAQHASPELSEILARMGKDSDNFVAEMVLKTLGAERKRKPGSSADGVSVVLATLHRLKLPLEGVTIVNGSGLYQGNHVTTALISELLRAMYDNPSLRVDFIGHLAVGGADGTLAHRMRELPEPRVVRAKTGTLDDVIALSGYVLGPTPERALAFSFIANGVTGKHAEARELGDHIAQALAAFLFRKP